MRTALLRAVSLIGVLALGAGCTIVPGENGGTSSGGPGAGQGGSGNGDGQGTGNTQGRPGAGGFKVSGRVALKLGGTTKMQAGVGATPTEPPRVTHVMGVTPASQDTRRVVAEVAPNGDFTLDLDPQRVWVLVFIDSTRVGSDMILGVFRAQGLDTVAPMEKGEANLGEVEAENGVAKSSLPYDDLLAAMKIDKESALFLGAIDDMCLRVVNPDVDGNGKIDELEDGKKFLLDFHVQFAMRATTNVIVTDMVDAFLPDTVTIDYGGTGIYASFAQKTFPSGWQSSTSASFDETIHYAPTSSSGPPGAPRSVEAGGLVPSADMMISGYGDYASVGLMAIAGYDMPQGNYRFGVGENTLTFSHVRTRTDAQLAAGESFILPFIRFDKSDAACEKNCTLSGFSYEWRKRTEGGWVPATIGEVALVAGAEGGYLSILLDNDQQKNIGYKIPIAAVSGTVAWDSVTNPDPALKTAALAATIEDLCHIGLSYDDKLGMRYFASIGDAPGTCGAP